MMRRWWLPSLSVLLIASGCATEDNLESSGPRVTYAQVKAAPETYTGQTVTFGGKVLSAKRLKEETRLEILQLPLVSSLKPALDLSTSQGRFVATKKEFLDPATLPAGTFVTITGAVAGAIILPLDETDYTYPVVEIKNLRVWQKEEEPPRIRPYIGPGPYWGPYWSPYWRPWPYYW
ncbi:MAG: Slp family lipoprotein [Nitrospira sp.]|nr:Slp family lipoprotein [Nitrospira sp.]